MKKVIIAVIVIAIIVVAKWYTSSQADELHPDCYGNDWPVLLEQFHIDCVNKAKELGIV